MTGPSSAATAVSVTMTAAGQLETDRWGDPVFAEYVEWSARVGRPGNLPGSGRLIVGVTAFSSRGSNRTWMDPRFYVAPGLNCEPPPDWVPNAPAWFWAAAVDLRPWSSL